MSKILKLNSTYELLFLKVSNYRNANHIIVSIVGLRMNLEESSTVQNQNYLSDLDKEAMNSLGYRNNGMSYNMINNKDNDENQHTVENRVGPRVIGSLPIAEYEGSPRRYGVSRQCDNARNQDQVVIKK